MALLALSALVIRIRISAEAASNIIALYLCISFGATSLLMRRRVWLFSNPRAVFDLPFSNPGSDIG
jgi:hypothetical protein